MKKNGTIIAIVAIILVAGGYFFWGSDIISLKIKNQERVIKIGVIAPLSGSAAQYGKWMVNGLKLSEEEINNHNDKIKFKIFVEDDNTNASKAINAYNKLKSLDKIDFFISATTSQNTLAIAPLAEKDKIILFAVTASTPDLTNAGDYIFRNWPSDNYEGKVMADYAYNNLKIVNVAIVTMNNDYGVGLGRVFSEHFKMLGGKIVYENVFEQGNTDFKTIASQITNFKPDAIYLPSHAKEAAIFIKQLQEQGVSVPVLGCVAFGSTEITAILGEKATNIYFTAPSFDLSSDKKWVQVFVQKYREKHNKDPEIFAAHAFDALNILYFAINNSDGTTEGVKTKIYEIDKFPGVSGTTTFDKNGDVAKDISIKKYDSGKTIDIGH